MISQIKTTKDYKLFKRVWHNRKLDPSHLKNLTASIAKKNLLAYTPIIVNKFMEVIDGQHRLEVAKTSNLDIYYMVADDIATGDILLLNANEKPWGMQDFLVSWINQGKKDYAALKVFAEHYEIPLTVSMNLLTGQNMGKRDLVREFKEGMFVITSKDEAKANAEKLVQIRKYCQVNVYKDRDLIRAIIQILPVIDWDRLVTKLGFVADAKGEAPIKRRATPREYLSMLEEIYNFKSRTTANERIF